jgi:hypothetical protein
MVGGFRQRHGRLQHVRAKSALPQTVQDYSAALANASGFLHEIEKAHANPLPGDPLAKTSTFSQPGSPTSGLNSRADESDVR